MASAAETVLHGMRPRGMVFRRKELSLIVGRERRPAWLAIQAERSGRMLVSTEGSTFDTVLAVYGGPPYPTGFGELTLLAEDDNGAPDGVSSRVVVDVIEHGVYHLAVDGVNGATGQVRLRYEIGQAPSVVRALQGQRPLVGQQLVLSVSVVSEVEVERPLAGQLVVERSWDLETWEAVWTDAPLEEVVRWLDAREGAADADAQFYRARLRAGD